MNDSELPIAQMFNELVEKAKAGELVEIEERRKIERTKELAIHRALNGGKLNASEMFMGTDAEQEDQKLKAQVLNNLDKINKDVAQAMQNKKEQQHGINEEDDFPPPPIT